MEKNLGSAAWIVTAATSEHASWASEKQTITVPVMCKNKDLLFKEHTAVSATSWCFWQESQKEQIGSAKLHSALTVWLHCCGGYDRCWNSTSNLNKNASSTKLGSTSPPLKMICNLWVVRKQGQWFYMYEGKGKIETSGKKFPPNDEVPSNIRQVCGSGNMLFAFHEFVQKWITAEAEEALEIHWANSKQINRLYSTCICKNKKQNIQRSQGADVWQLIPASDVYLPVALFSNLLRIPSSCWFFTLCSAFLRSKTNGKGNIRARYQWIWNTWGSWAVLVLRARTEHTTAGGGFCL